MPKAILGTQRRMLGQSHVLAGEHRQHAIADQLEHVAAPLAFGLLIDRMGAGILIVSSALSLAGLLALCPLRQTPAQS